MADVFISYKHQDRPRAERLADALSRSAFSVWWDREIEISEGFRQAIERELKSAGCVVVLWSVHSIGVSGENFVLDEADSVKPKLIQACVDTVQAPMGFGQTQRVDLTDWTGEPAHDGYQDLVRAISFKLNRPYTALTPQRRALVIGVEHYEAGSDLAISGAPVANADALTRALVAAEGGGFKTQLMPDAKCHQIESALKTLVQQTATNDLALLYFAGRAELTAELTKDDGLYLCASDTLPDSLERTGIGLSWLRKKILNSLAAEHVIVVLDCDCSADPTLVQRQLVDELGQGKGKHLAAWVVPSVGGPARRNAFTRALADGLANFKADRTADGIITLDEWLEHAAQAVESDGPPALRQSFDVPAGAVEIARRPASAAVPDRAPIANPEALDRVQKSVRRNVVIPFLGDGVYGNGPLSGFELVRALAQRSHALKSASDQPLATVAEYHVETADDREDFLAQFRGTLSDQMSRCQPRLAHDFVMSLQTPWLVISTTYDWLLEQRLRDAGQAYTVVGHVLRCRDASRQGHLAVVRFGSEPRFETCQSDELLLDEKRENVIYKILGSPFLHDFADPAASIDTVVVTETDHSLFLARLDNQVMRVPTAFSRPLQLRQLLFLGYNLDVWHYRLVGHVFSKGGPAPAERAPFAVRQPTSAMEESFWKRLGAEMIKTDAETFIGALQGEPA